MGVFGGRWSAGLLAIYPRSLVAKGEEIGKKTGDFSGQFSYWIRTRVRSLAYREDDCVGPSVRKKKRARNVGEGKEELARWSWLPSVWAVAALRSAGRSFRFFFLFFLFSVLFYSWKNLLREYVSLEGCELATRGLLKMPQRTHPILR